MGLLKILSLLLVLVFPIAEVGRIQFSNGVAVSLNDIFVGILIVAWVVWHLHRQKKIKKNFLTVPIIVFATVALLSLAVNIFSFSLDKLFVAFLYLVRWVSYAALYFIFNEFDVKFKKKILVAILFSGMVVVLLGFVQFFFYPSLRNLYYLGWDEHLYRLFSSFLDPNFVGAFFVMLLMLELNLVRENWAKKKTFFLASGIGIAVLTLTAIYLTYSRSALIMLVVCVITYLVLAKQKRLIIISVIGMILLVFILPKSFKTEDTNYLRITSSGARVSAASQAINIFMKNPLLGVGFDTYRYAQNKEGLGGQYLLVSHGAAGTDNSFLFILATTGVVGFIAFLFLLSKMVMLGVNHLGKNNLVIVLVSILLGLIVNSLFINSLFYVLILEWVWILCSFTESS